MKYKLVSQAMDSKEGQKLYKLLSANFDKAVNLTPHIEQVLNKPGTFLGSQKQLEVLVWEILNEKVSK